METLAGRVAVITGGAQGIGLATAKRLAEEGMKVARRRRCSRGSTRCAS